VEYELRRVHLFANNGTSGMQCVSSIRAVSAFYLEVVPVRRSRIISDGWRTHVGMTLQGTLPRMRPRHRDLSKVFSVAHCCFAAQTESIQ
jgi:hypothetical protein